MAEINVLLEGKNFKTEFGIIGYCSVILIREDGKNILFDTGIRGSISQLKDSLNKLNLTCDDITDVIISHMHFDHVGNVSLFKNATFHLSEEEWNSMKEPIDHYICLESYEYIKNNMKYDFVKEGDKLTTNTTIIELPGHTKGLIGLKCNEDIIICSDAIKNRFEMWCDIPLMTIDNDLSMKTKNRIIKEAKYIYPGHDKMLEVGKPIIGEPMEFKVLYVDGDIKTVKK